MNELKKSSSAIVWFLVSIVVGNILLQNDFLPFLSWWFILGLLGVICLPLANKMFSTFIDKGYLFSKILGISIAGYILWLLSTLHILKFTTTSCYIVVALLFLVILFIQWLKGNKSLQNVWRLDLTAKNARVILTEEILFFFVFLVWTYIRGFKPEAYGTEKFMDYGFMTTMMRSEYMPPQDLWFAGESINYYYVGQYLATFLTKLSRVRVNEGYNLMLMTLASFGFVLPFSIVYNLLHIYGQEMRIKVKKIAIFGGIIAGAAVSLASNMHFVLYYFIVPKIRIILEIEGDFDSYWFPDSTRYIGYNPDTSDKTIHEYPSYSYILGDLHAHVLNTIFVFTLLAILLSYMIKVRNKKIEDKKHIISLIKEHVLQVDIIIIGFLIGLFHTTNFWDFPIYYVVAGAIILFTNIKYMKRGRLVALVTALQGVSILIFARIVAFPFNVQFDTISSQILLSDKRTPLFQLIILWGLPIGLVISFIIYQYKQSKDDVLGDAKKESSNIITQMIGKMNICDLFVLTIGLCAVGLVLMPEVVYVKDIYSGDYKRANTMFKLTYQAFILFGISYGYIIIRFIAFNKKQAYRFIGFISLFLLCCTVWYSKVAITAWYGNITKVNNYQGLDSAAFMKTKMNDDALATEWMNENIDGLPVIVEAYGSSYSDYERISVVTGLPTVVGWHVHEWLWRGDESLVSAREADVDTLYTSTDINEVKKIIEKYKIEYIYLGRLEKEKYENLNKKLLLQLGEVAFQSYIQDETYIIKVNK